MAFKIQSLQKSRGLEVQDGDMLGSNSNNEQNEIEVRQGKSMTFNQTKQSILHSGNHIQIPCYVVKKQVNDQDNKKENKLIQPEGQEDNRNTLMYSPGIQTKNYITSPRNEEINSFINRQGQMANLFSNSQYDSSDHKNNQKWKKSGNEMMPADFINDQESGNKQQAKQLIKYSSFELNKMIENNAVQSSQVNVILNQNGKGIFQSNISDNHSFYSIKNPAFSNNNNNNKVKNKKSQVDIDEKTVFQPSDNNLQNHIDNQISLEYSNQIVLDSFQQKSPNMTHDYRAPTTNNNSNNKNNNNNNINNNSRLPIHNNKNDISELVKNNGIQNQLYQRKEVAIKDQNQQNIQSSHQNQQDIQQQPSNTSSKIKDGNTHKLDGEGGIDNISLQKTGEFSLHLHKLLKGNASLQVKEAQKIMVYQILGMFVEIVQLFKRGFFQENRLFLIIAPLSIGIQIISIIPIVTYLQKITSQVQENHFRKLFFFALSQVLRTLVFLNNFISYNQSISILEAIVEIYFILQIIRQVLPNFQIFRLKSKIMLFEGVIFIIGGICMLDYDINDLYIQIVQWVAMIVLIFLTQFYFKEFPYSICGIYDAQNEHYSLMKRSYFSQKILESQFNDQLGLIPHAKNIDPHNNQQNIIIEGKVHNGIQAANFQTPNEMWVLEHRNPNENNTQYIDAINKNEAKNMITNASQFVLLNEKIQTVYVSMKMNSQIQNLFTKKEGNVHLKSQSGPQLSTNQQNIPMAATTATTASHTKFNGNTNENLFTMFDQFIEKVIIERVDIETMNLWENLIKSNKRPSYVIPNNINDSSSQYLSNRQRLAPPDYHQSQMYTQQPLQYSQFNPYPTQNLSTFKDIIQMRNSIINSNKVSASAITTNNIGFSSKIGLKSKNIMITLKEFLTKFSRNWVYFKNHYENKPIVVASFSTDDAAIDISELKKYQIKIYPQTKKKEQGGDPIIENQDNSVQSVVGITTSKKFIQDNENELKDCPISFLIVFEEVQQREKIVNKTQFYQFLKSLFRCFNNDLTQSLGNILGTSQAGIQSKNVSEEVKDSFIRPILLSCRIIKYILHNLRDFNDLVGERFQLHVGETSIPKVAEDSVILFKATSDKHISFKVVINSEVPIVISTDQRRLVQIIITLLSNAHKHTQTGSLIFRIFHPLQKGGQLNRNQLRFQVEDTGEGMDDSIQLKLSKLFNSGIGYQDFKNISTFGFNLFICNIIAKKLFNPEYQYNVSKERECMSEPNSDASGIKFKSIPFKGSVFYFDIKLIEEKKQERMQDSVLNYIQGNNVVPTISEMHSIKNNPSVKGHIIITNSQQGISPQSNLSVTEREFHHQNIPISRFIHRDPSRNLTSQTQVDGLDIADEVKIESSKNETRMMTFQQQPKGIHFDYRFLKCQCKNILIIDKVLRNLESLEILLTNSNFLPQKCCSIQEAIQFCEEKSQKQCTTCNQKTYICIFLKIDEFQKQDMNILAKEFEAFTNSPYCNESVIIVIGNMTQKTKKLLENARIDDQLSDPFDNYELYYLINNWRLLPISDSFYTQSSTAKHIQQSN